MSGVLARWNALRLAEAAEEILPCCGSEAWAQAMAGRRPILDEAALLATSDEVWKSLSEFDWMEAFRSHPRIGESTSAGIQFSAIGGLVGRRTTEGWHCDQRCEECVSRSEPGLRAALRQDLHCLC